MDSKITYNLRENYLLNELSEKNVSKNPINQFEIWFKEALSSNIKEPNAMIVSTVSNEKPRSRVALLKDFREEGFVFFTNYLSDKGKEIAENANGALTFFWVDLERQVRIEGEFEKVSALESDEYFSSRPRSSQIGAWVSKQSEDIPDREFLEEKLLSFEKEFENIEIIPRPENWGGYILKPNYFEFWQGRPNRLHDRIAYEFNNGDWEIKRLSS